MFQLHFQKHFLFSFKTFVSLSLHLPFGVIRNVTGTLKLKDITIEMDSRKRSPIFEPSSGMKSNDLQMEVPTEKTTLINPSKPRSRRTSKSYGTAEGNILRKSLIGYDNNTFEFDKQIKEIIKEEEPKPQAKAWDEDDQFDHVLPLHQILHRYKTDPKQGLTHEQVIINREKHGSNILLPPKKVSQFRKFIQAIVGGLNALLLASSVLSFVIYGIQVATTGTTDKDDLYLGVALVIVVCVSGMFTFFQELKSDRIMESFKKMVPRVAIVYRDGKRREIDAGELVVGDIIDVKLGDLIPADIRIVDCVNFKVDNSGLTGESEAQKRSKECTSSDPMETKNLAFFSTNAIEGSATGLVVRVGEKTLMGRLATLSSTVDAGRSPIGVEMDRFILIMTLRSFIIGMVFLFIAIMMGYHWLEAIFFIIGIMVANIPEGLSVTFTMILSLTAKRMASKNCLVKHLQAVEALGSTSVICSDKTGTLTQNKMTVSHMWFNDEIHDAETSERRIGVSFDNEDPGFAALGNVAVLCSRAVFKPGQENVPLQERIVEGDASEAGILKCMEEQYGDIMSYRAKFPKICEIPFNSTNKFQVSIHDLKDPADPRYLLVMKGAPEKIISLCTTILVQDKEYPLEDEWKKKFEQVYEKLGSYGERVLGFCDCRLDAEKYPPDKPVFDAEQPNNEFLNEGFRFVGLISMVDPPKSSVPNAVAKCRSAGIKVVMVTGDHHITAAAIARTVGIISEHNLTRDEIAAQRGIPVDEVDPEETQVAVLTGSELKQMSSDELKEVLSNHQEIVFARTSPEQKYIIVSAFQELGNIVAATGDGVNDSPALKKADIGVAMGISGTEVSKETADLILMDDNFATIVTGVEEGRLIFDNLKKLISYSLGDNCAELYCVWVFIILRVPLPLGTIAMLLIMLGTDVMPAISIAHESAEADIMRLKPRDPKTQTLVTSQLMSYTYGQTSVMEFIAGMFSYFAVFALNGWLPSRMVGIEKEWDSKAINDLPDSYGQEWCYFTRQRLKVTAQTASFIAIVLMQVVNVICCKTRRMSIFQKGMDNWNMNLGIIFELALACFFIYTPRLNSGLQFAGLPIPIWLLPLPFATVLFVYDEYRRWAIRRSQRNKGWAFQELYT